MSWIVHVADAHGRLDGLIEPIGGALERARRRAETVTRPVALDVVVQVRPGRVIPERGHVGHALTEALIHLTFDPANRHCWANLGEALERTIVHELHHALRWSDPGYGRTLGEALVSEGLAGHFARQLYDNPPEPWEAVDLGDMLADIAFVAEARWERTDYDHGEWFFGLGGYPRWVGYTLGYRMIGAYLDRHPDATAAALATARASTFRDTLSLLGRGVGHGG